MRPQMNCQLGRRPRLVRANLTPTRKVKKNFIVPQNVVSRIKNTCMAFLQNESSCVSWGPIPPQRRKNIAHTWRPWCPGGSFHEWSTCPSVKIPSGNVHIWKACPLKITLTKYFHIFAHTLRMILPVWILACRVRSLTWSATNLHPETAHECVDLVLGVLSSAGMPFSAVLEVFLSLTRSSNFWLLSSTFGGDSLIEADSFSDWFSVGEKDPELVSLSSKGCMVDSNWPGDNCLV